MGTTLTGTKPKDTYDSLIKVEDNGPISGTAKYLSDGLGNNLPIAVSTSNVGIGTTTPNAKLDVGYVAGGVSFRVQRDNNNILDFYQGGGISYIDSSPSGGQIAFSTVGVERARITANGLTFNGDTAAANALDDYEEGTFTPTVAGSTSAGTATYTTQVAKYTKIGRQVSCQIDLEWYGGTGTGDLRITGLPFTDTSATNPAVTIGYLDGITLTALNYALAYIASSATRIDFVQIPTGGGTLTSVAYDAAGRIIVNVTYTA